MPKSDSLHPSVEPNDAVDVVEHEEEEPAFGWTPYSELVNGRVAMLAVFGLLLLEWITKQDLFTWLGLR